MVEIKKFEGDCPIKPIAGDIVDIGGKIHMKCKRDNSGDTCIEQKFDNPKTVKLNACERISARSTTRCIGQKIIQNVA